MKKNYKLLSLALAVLLCSVCLSACGSTEPVQTTTTTTAAAATTTAAATTLPGEPVPAGELGLESFCYSAGQYTVEYTYQFDYLEWGSSLDDVALNLSPILLERNTTRELADDPSVKVYSSTVPVALDGQTTTLHFTFENEKLIRIDLPFKPEDDGTWFTKQLEGLLELYGESIAATNDMAEVHRWRTDISQLQIARQFKDNSVQIIVGSLPPAPEATISALDFGSTSNHRFRGIEWFSTIEDARAVLPFTFYRNSTFEPEDDPTVHAYSSQTPVTLDGVEGDLRLIYENEELVQTEFSFRLDDDDWYYTQLDTFTKYYGQGDVIDIQSGKTCIWRTEQTVLQLTLIEGSRWTSVTIKLGPLE